MSAADIALAFTKHYYGTRDADPANLANLYQPHSALTFEGQQFRGPAEILGKFQAIGKARHAALTVDAQQQAADSVDVFVTGQLVIGDNGTNALQFAHAFRLEALAGSYCIGHEFFRLIY